MAGTGRHWQGNDRHHHVGDGFEERLAHRDDRAEHRIKDAEAHPFPVRTRLADNYATEAYCPTCLQVREFTGRVEDVNGRRLVRGACPVCGAPVARTLPT